MLTVKEPMLSPAGTDAEPLDPVADALAELDELDELDELQAAAVSARAAARPANPSRRKRRNVLPPCEREPQAPIGLLPILNPHIPSLEREFAPISRCGSPYSTTWSDRETGDAKFQKSFCQQERSSSRSNPPVMMSMPACY
jgi:hypothetical protein